MATNLNGLCIGQYQACVLVVNALDTDCTPLTGSDREVIMNSLASFDAQPQYDEGQEFGRRNSCGTRLWYVRDCNKLKQWDLTIGLITWDLEALELMTGSTVLVGAGGGDFDGDAMGLETPGQDSGCAPAVSLEVYTKAAFGTSGTCPPAASGAPAYVRHLFPYASLQFGQITFDDNTDGILCNITGFALPNPNWGTGPNDDWPAASAVSAETPYAFVFTNDLPTAGCGYTS